MKQMKSEESMSKKYNIVKTHYDDGTWTMEQVRNAVIKGWITESEYTEITGQQYD